ncbi:hypothetical protein [Poseidonocella sp. HB161398]|uniref:hypothetical protein n=1 Tax=Poseidonocella sp. HB161398 TaxID=2320855 RepID=UPI001108FB2D|nr:hypothetical protein [Poseidonocella sp. HB161398]
MIQVIFHIGMGKTGTTSIQSALSKSTKELKHADCRYVGTSIEDLGHDIGNPYIFSDFLTQPQGKYPELAKQFAAALNLVHTKDGTTRFIISNESYFTRIKTLSPFFISLADFVNLSVVVYARPVGSWLPSACSQWGNLHKTNAGPIRSLPQIASRLIRQYSSLSDWRNALGDVVNVRQYHQKKNIVEDFSLATNVPLHFADQKRNIRRRQSELILRAAFNNQFEGKTTPREFSKVFRIQSPGHLPTSLSDKFRFLFDYDQLSVVIEKYTDQIRRIEKEFDLDLLSTPISNPPNYDQNGLVNEIIGELIDITSRQSIQIDDLLKRIEKLEKGKAGDKLR